MRDDGRVDIRQLMTRGYHVPGSECSRAQYRLINELYSFAIAALCVLIIAITQSLCFAECGGTNTSADNGASSVAGCDGTIYYFEITASRFNGQLAKYDVSSEKTFIYEHTDRIWPLAWDVQRDRLAALFVIHPTNVQFRLCLTSLPTLDPVFELGRPMSDEVIALSLSPNLSKIAVIKSNSGNWLQVEGLRKDGYSLWVLDVTSPTEPRVVSGFPVPAAPSGVAWLPDSVGVAFVAETNIDTDSVKENLTAKAANVQLRQSNEVNIRVLDTASLQSSNIWKGVDPWITAYDGGIVVCSESGVHRISADGLDITFITSDRFLRAGYRDAPALCPCGTSYAFTRRPDGTGSKDGARNRLLLYSVGRTNQVSGNVIYGCKWRRGQSEALGP